MTYLCILSSNGSELGIGKHCEKREKVCSSVDQHRAPDVVRLHHKVTACQSHGQGVCQYEWDRNRREISYAAVHQCEYNGCQQHRAAKSNHRLEALQEDA